MTEDSCPIAIVKTSAMGFGLGGIAALTSAAWKDSPQEKKLIMKVMGDHTRNFVRKSLLYGGLLGIYQAGECVAKKVRARDDGWNAFYGGAASGAAYGVYGKQISLSFLPDLPKSCYSYHVIFMLFIYLFIFAEILVGRPSVAVISGAVIGLSMLGLNYFDFHLVEKPKRPMGGGLIDQ
jgi:hypothetical protein